MQYDSTQENAGLGTRILTLLLRIFLPVAILAVAFVVMYLGFVFLRAGDAPKWLVVIVAIVWGVGGVAALYWIFNWIVERMGARVIGPEEVRAKLGLTKRAPRS